MWSGSFAECIATRCDRRVAKTPYIEQRLGVLYIDAGVATLTVGSRKCIYSYLSTSNYKHLKPITIQESGLQEPYQYHKNTTIRTRAQQQNSVILTRTAHPTRTPTSSTMTTSRTISSTSVEPAHPSSDLNEEATVDTILADYHAKEAQRRSSTASEISKNVPSPGWKTQHGETPRAMLNRIGGFFGNIIDGKGWRRS